MEIRIFYLQLGFNPLCWFRHSHDTKGTLDTINCQADVFVCDARTVVQELNKHMFQSDMSRRWRSRGKHDGYFEAISSFGCRSASFNWSREKFACQHSYLQGYCYWLWNESKPWGMPLTSMTSNHAISWDVIDLWIHCWLPPSLRQRLRWWIIRATAHVV